MKWDVSGIDSNGKACSLFIDAKNEEYAKRIAEQDGYESVFVHGEFSKSILANKLLEKDNGFQVDVLIKFVLFVIFVGSLSFGLYNMSSCISSSRPSESYSTPAPTQQYTSQEEQEARDVLSRQGFEGEELEKVLDLSKKMQKLQNEGK